jgi:glycosyltransferase involved in cell wall biosynthesis
VSCPLVSVGISFFNSGDSLLDSVRSIFAQTYSNWELILVDDGSTDNSIEVAASIDDPRVRFLPPDGKNRRLPARLNQITRAAKGDYIARMDADDKCHPERFARQLEFLRTHPEVDVVGSSSCILDKQGRPAKKLVTSETHEEIFKGLFKGGGVSIVHPSIMGKAKWFRRWPYDENNIRCEDYELWVRSRRDSIFANLPDLLCFKDEFLSFSLSKYAKSKHSGALLLWEYAPSEFSRFKAAYKVCKQYLQLGVYAGAKLLGMHGKLISRRYCPLSPQERAEVNVAIDVIRKTKVPVRKIEQRIY